MIIGFSYTFPFTIDFQQKQIVGEIDTVSPALFKNTNHRQCFFHCHHINTCLECLAAADGIHVAVKLLNGTMFQFSIKKAKQYSIIGKQLACIFAIAFCYTLYKLHGSFLYSLVFFN